MKMKKIGILLAMVLGTVLLLQGQITQATTYTVGSRLQTGWFGTIIGDYVDGSQQGMTTIGDNVLTGNQFIYYWKAYGDYNTYEFASRYADINDIGSPSWGNYEGLVEEGSERGSNSTSLTTGKVLTGIKFTRYRADNGDEDGYYFSFRFVSPSDIGDASKRTDWIEGGGDKLLGHGDREAKQTDTYEVAVNNAITGFWFRRYRKDSPSYDQFDTYTFSYYYAPVGVVPVDALDLAASASPDPISVGDTSTITFEVTKGGADVSEATVNGISVAGGGSISAGTVGNDCLSQNTDGNGKCTVTYNAVAPTTATITATNATKAGETTSGSASITVTVNSCIPPRAVQFVSTPYIVGDPINYNATYDDGVDYTRCLYKDGSEIDDDLKTGTGDWQGSAAVATASVGTWVVTLEHGISGCPLFASADSCRASTIVSAVVPPVCTPNWSCTWAACDGAQKIQTCTDLKVCGEADYTNSAECCRNDGDCIASFPGVREVCDFPPDGVCVECLTNDDCVGTEVCNLVSNSCTPCKTEGEEATDASLCCEGILGWWDIDGDGNNECTSACDPNAWYYCNPLRTNVETLAEGGERIIGYILGLIGSITLLLIIISGAMYMTSAGNEEKIASSKKILTAAVIGLAIALLAYSLLAVIMGVLGV